MTPMTVQDERHQILIDGLSAMVFTGQISAARAIQIEAEAVTRYRDKPADEIHTIDHGILAALRIDLGLDPFDCATCHHDRATIQPVARSAMCAECKAPHRF